MINVRRHHRDGKFTRTKTIFYVHHTNFCVELCGQCEVKIYSFKSKSVRVSCENHSLRFENKSKSSMRGKGSSTRNNVSTSVYLPFYKVTIQKFSSLYLLSKSARDTINHSKFHSVAIVLDFLAKFPTDRSGERSVFVTHFSSTSLLFFLFSLSLNIMFIVRTSVHFFFVSLGSDVCMCRSIFAFARYQLTYK